VHELFGFAEFDSSYCQSTVYMLAQCACLPQAGPGMLQLVQSLKAFTLEHTPAQRKFEGLSIMLL